MPSGLDERRSSGRRSPPSERRACDADLVTRRSSLASVEVAPDLRRRGLRPVLRLDERRVDERVGEAVARRRGSTREGAGRETARPRPAPEGTRLAAGDARISSKVKRKKEAAAERERPGRADPVAGRRLDEQARRERREDRDERQQPLFPSKHAARQRGEKPDESDSEEAGKDREQPRGSAAGPGRNRSSRCRAPRRR